LSKSRCGTQFRVLFGESKKFISQDSPILLIEPELREETRLGAAYAVFWRQQIIPHFRRIHDRSFSARNLHVEVLMSSG
jgi:hypothetical protein